MYTQRNSCFQECFQLDQQLLINNILKVLSLVFSQQTPKIQWKKYLLRGYYEAPIFYCNNINHQWLLCYSFSILSLYTSILLSFAYYPVFSLPELISHAQTTALEKFLWLASRSYCYHLAKFIIITELCMRCSQIKLWSLQKPFQAPRSH